jgi:DNA polymerase-1
MSNNQTLYLIDASSYLYRAYHALPPLTNSYGEPTGAVFGVANMLRKLVAEQKPEYIAVIFDAKGKNFRHELYSEYKANRPPMPDDLRQQIEPLHKLVKAMGLPLVCIEGVEADDVIATLAIQAETDGWQVKISTVDKDIMQLVNANIKIINEVKKIEYDEDGVFDKFGVPASMVADYLALIGDKVDNVPGVPGVGPKTAAKWLNEYQGLDNLIQKADQIKNKAGQSLRDHLHILPLSKQLVILKSDVDLQIALSDLKKKTTQSEQLIKLLETLDFKSWLNDEQKNISASNDVSLEVSRETSSNKIYKIIQNKEDFVELLKNLQSCLEFCFDTETTSLDVIDAELVGLSFSYKPGESYYIPVGHRHENNLLTDQLDINYVIDNLKPIFSNNKISKIAQNLKYDQTVLSKYGVLINTPIEDTMLESYVYNSTANKHDLDTLAEVVLQHTNIKYEDVAGKGAKQINFAEVELTKAGEYAAEDADIALQLHHHFRSLLQQDQKLEQVYQTIEKPVVSVLAKMEAKGVLINSDLLKQQSIDLEQKLLALEQKIYTAVDLVFNIDSPKQLQEVLYEKMNLPILEKTPTGQPSTAEPVLQDLAFDYPIAKDILDYRSLRKLKSTYTDRLPLQVNNKTNRIHTSFHQAVTATGRLSSSNPNLQNIPIRTEEGRKIRQAFIAEQGYSLISCDYSQIELRIMAHLSQDDNLLKAFNNDEDIHSFTAAEIFNIDLSEVSSEQRRHAKAINFGLIYGMSSFGLAKQLGISRNDAQTYIDVYFARYPGVKKYMDDIRNIAQQQGYVETLFGRRLYLPEIKSKNLMRRRALERLAINAPMQGTAADIIKKAMIAVDKNLTEHAVLKNKAFLILQVHDELIVEVHDDNLQEAKKIIVNAMQTAASLAVPLKVSCNVGHNWDEAH